jgi:hypothetical protein
MIPPAVIDRFIVLIALVLAACVSGCLDDKSCEDGKRTYRYRDVWTCSDGCHLCVCDDSMVRVVPGDCSPGPDPSAAGKLTCHSKITNGAANGYRHGTAWICDDSSEDCQLCLCDDGLIKRTPCTE